MATIIEGSVNGIDLCSIQDQPAPIDANSIRAAGFEFAYVKSSQYSSTKDQRFDSLVDRLRNAGLRVGAYHFCSHDTDPVAQANWFYRASKGLGSAGGELPPMCDWEFCTPQRYPDHPVHCVRWIESFCKEVERLWYPNNDDRLVPRHPVLYSYPGYCGGHQPALAASALDVYPLCLASYRNDGSIPAADVVLSHAIPAPWKQWTLCQYSGDKGVKAPGIRGACDRQVFNGTSGQWADFIGLRRDVSQTVGDVKEDEFSNR